MKHANHEAEGKSSERDEEPNSAGCRLSRCLLIDQSSLRLGRVTWDSAAAVPAPSRVTRALFASRASC